MTKYHNKIKRITSDKNKSNGTTIWFVCFCLIVSVLIPIGRKFNGAYIYNQFSEVTRTNDSMEKDSLTLTDFKTEKYTTRLLNSNTNSTNNPVEDKYYQEWGEIATQVKEGYQLQEITNAQTPVAYRDETIFHPIIPAMFDFFIDEVHFLENTDSTDPMQFNIALLIDLFGNTFILEAFQPDLNEDERAALNHLRSFVAFYVNSHEDKRQVHPISLEPYDPGPPLVDLWLEAYHDARALKESDPHQWDINQRIANATGQAQETHFNIYHYPEYHLHRLGYPNYDVGPPTIFYRADRNQFERLVSSSSDAGNQYEPLTPIFSFAEVYGVEVENLYDRGLEGAYDEQPINEVTFDREAFIQELVDFGMTSYDTASLATDDLLSKIQAYPYHYYFSSALQSDFNQIMSQYSISIPTALKQPLFDKLNQYATELRGDYDPYQIVQDGQDYSLPLHLFTGTKVVQHPGMYPQAIEIDFDASLMHINDTPYEIQTIQIEPISIPIIKVGNDHPENTPVSIQISLQNTAYSAHALFDTQEVYAFLNEKGLISIAIPNILNKHAITDDSAVWIEYR